MLYSLLLIDDLIQADHRSDLDLGLGRSRFSSTESEFLLFPSKHLHPHSLNNSATCWYSPVGVLKRPHIQRTAFIDKTLISGTMDVTEMWVCRTEDKSLTLQF